MHKSAVSARSDLRQRSLETVGSCWSLTPSSCLPEAWGQLEKAEHEREAALRAELIRQEKLELLAQRFDHKVAMRESWLNENQRLVSQVQAVGLGSGWGGREVGWG